MKTFESDPQELFERWYVVPLRWLEAIPNGDGAFVAFAVSLALYERFAKAAIKKDTGKKANDIALCGRLAQDFGVSESEAEEFWQVMRHGLQHQAMPMQSQQGASSLPGWLFNGNLPRPIQFGRQGSQRMLLVQPWLFRDIVLRMYRSRPDLIDYNQSFPWASIYPMEFGV